mmetsp:Transcript_3462/g.12053  ORF Transcript_3462/g.12053 Transcript_3462/m.12053 type:complete len:241 (+) Transcript_3462:125-847(+)
MDLVIAHIDLSRGCHRAHVDLHWHAHLRTGRPPCVRELEACRVRPGEQPSAQHQVHRDRGTCRQRAVARRGHHPRGRASRTPAHRRRRSVGQGHGLGRGRAVGGALRDARRRRSERRRHGQGQGQPRRPRARHAHREHRLVRALREAGGAHAHRDGSGGARREPRARVGGGDDGVGLGRRGYPVHSGGPRVLEGDVRRGGAVRPVRRELEGGGSGGVVRDLASSEHHGCRQTRSAGRRRP